MTTNKINWTNGLTGRFTYVNDHKITETHTGYFVIERLGADGLPGLVADAVIAWTLPDALRMAGGML